jgi:hypothetical protein
VQRELYAEFLPIFHILDVDAFKEDILPVEDIKKAKKQGKGKTFDQARYQENKESNVPGDTTDNDLHRTTRERSEPTKKSEQL